jgi:hypothetical protein
MLQSRDFRTLITLLACTAALGCAADGPMNAPRAELSSAALKETVSKSVLPSAEAPAGLSTPAETALINRILARFPEGDARDVLRMSLSRSYGLSGRPQITGDPFSQALVDSLYNLRLSRGKRLAAEK